MSRDRGERARAVSNGAEPEMIDLSIILRPYENQWVALSEDNKTVLGAGSTVQEAKEKAAKKSKSYRFMKVLPFDVSYVPLGG
jgi:hypothetical protein